MGDIKTDLLRVIKSPLPTILEEDDAIWWVSRLAEAKRHLLRKIKVCDRKVKDLEIELNIEEAKISNRYLSSSAEGPALDRKKKAENMYILSSLYKQNWEEIHSLQELADSYNADLENVNDKTFAVRKIMDFIKVHMLYEE